MPIPAQLLPEPLPAEPLAIAARWLEEATRLAAQPNPNSMSLATVDGHGQPSARIVLCKDILARPGLVSFYTNYDSRKGAELATNPRAAIVLHWDHLHRQVRVEGTIVRAPAEDSDAYFATRPWQRRIGAWASEQSRPVSGRQALVDAVVATAKRFGAPVPGPGKRSRAGPHRGSAHHRASRALGRIPVVGERRRVVGGRRVTHP
jgi:pyridoxamine 5'-phosphate oxidase